MVSELPQSASGTTVLVAINALGPRGEYRARNSGIITDTAGAALAECSKVSDCSLCHVSPGRGRRRRS